MAFPIEGMKNGSQEFSDRDYSFCGFSLSMDEMETMFDEVMKEKQTATKSMESPDVKVPETTVPISPKAIEQPVRGEQTSSIPATRSLNDILADAASFGVKGVDEAFKGLYELFGGSALKSFPAGFDESSYQKAKPHFQAAFESFNESGKNLKEFFTFIIDNLGSGIKPYFMRFIQDLKGVVQETPITETNTTQTEPVSTPDNKPDTVESEPVAETEPVYGANNVLVSIDQANAARERMRKKLGQFNTGMDTELLSIAQVQAARERVNKKLGQLNAGIDPELLRAGIGLAGYHIEDGARKFTDYVHRMVADLGDGIRPFLKLFYIAVREYPGLDSAGMNTEEEINAIDIDSVVVGTEEKEKPEQAHTSNSDTHTKWFNSPVTYHHGTLTEIRKRIPTFERRSFGLTQSGNELSRLNERLDTIVRQPFGEDMTFIPVGVVSKGYVLVQHTDVLDVAAKALKEAKIKPEGTKAELEITGYGERIALSIYLPDSFSFDPGDGHPLALRLECFNSVDGSTRFRVLMGWFRFVCSNGLVIGVTRSDVRRRHVGDLGLADVETVLKSGIQESDKEQKNFKLWRQRRINHSVLILWIEKDLRKEWGFKAAARTYHIALTGHDAEIIGPYKDNTPITIPVRKASRVPGAPAKLGNLYDLSQILAWIAKERRDIQEQLEWRERIPELLKPLMN
jgi:hypothetical protein